MHSGADSVVLDAVLEASAPGAACAFNLCVNQAPDGFAPGERVPVYCYGFHRSTSSHRMETSRPLGVRIHRLDDLVSASTISEPVRLRGPVPFRRWITSSAAAARPPW